MSQPPYAGPVLPAPVPQTSGKATSALVLGILSLVLCGLFAGIPAIVLGVVARSEIRASAGRLDGDGLALAGIVTGVLGTLWSLVLAGLLVLGLAVGSTVLGQGDDPCESSVATASGDRPVITRQDCS